MKLFANTLLLSALSLPLIYASSAVAAEKYTLDPTHTNVVWHANHLGFSTPSGKFSKVEGVLMLDEKTPANSTLNVVVDTGSVVTGIEKFDTHLKSPDFFNSAKFASATFVSKKVEVTGKDTAKVEGDFTLLGITKPLTLNVKMNKIDINPFTKKKTAGFSATTTIKRSDFGMSYGVPNVGDDVTMTIESEATLAE